MTRTSLFPIFSLVDNDGAGRSGTDAREREATAYREFGTIADSAIIEGLGTVAAGNRRLGQQLDQVQRAETAEQAALDALRDGR